ncbi:nuclear transport factor 2 family protein [Reyranella sp.]|uniref:nuclear transport factor 2 family protein n=1 Tax=Reyranella sp. TaxID=1929291 RepID=UPI003D0F0406
MLARRSSLIAGMVALVAGPAAFGQTPEVAQLRDELMALEKGSWDFMRDRNFDGMRNFLADDALLIFGDGTRFNKRQMMELMADYTMVGDIKIEPTFAVRMLTPDVATLLYRVTYTSSYKGSPPTTLKVLSSSVYVKRNGKWLSVLYQETPLK